jgi:hypothetical protein
VQAVHRREAVGYALVQKFHTHPESPLHQNVLKIRQRRAVFQHNFAFVRNAPFVRGWS